MHEKGLVGWRARSTPISRRASECRDAEAVRSSASCARSGDPRLDRVSLSGIPPTPSSGDAREGSDAFGPLRVASTCEAPGRSHDPDRFASSVGLGDEEAPGPTPGPPNQRQVLLPAPGSPPTGDRLIANPPKPPVGRSHPQRGDSSGAPSASTAKYKMVGVVGSRATTSRRWTLGAAMQPRAVRPGLRGSAQSIGGGAEGGSQVVGKSKLTRRVGSVRQRSEKEVGEKRSAVHDREPDGSCPLTCGSLRQAGGRLRRLPARSLRSLRRKRWGSLRAGFAARRATRECR